MTRFARRRSGEKTTIKRLRRRPIGLIGILIAGLGAIALLPTAVVAAYTVIDPPLTPLMIIRSLEGEPIRHIWRPLDSISEHLHRAVIAAEDNFFCQHHGFDVGAMIDQIDIWTAGGRPRGASTITMQTAKNTLLWPRRDLVRKGLEAWMTPQIEVLWSKRRILEVYLNIAEFGAGIYGAETAARAYFGVSAARLDRQQASLLAAILPNPRSWSPASAHVQRKAGILRARVTQLGPLLSCLDPRRGGRYS